ncbi:MAG: hypothetical protein FWG98_01535 [Candidatus Cloacimonetes bacterium]|nr:hypothetical protein [Candidatus Cloacimonadota bacterium]
MVSKKLVYIVFFLLNVLLVKSLLCEENHINGDNQSIDNTSHINNEENQTSSENGDNNLEENIENEDLQQHPENMNGLMYDFEETEGLQQRRQRNRELREINFTKDDIVRFAAEDMERIVYTESLYEVPYQDKLKINNIWLINTQLPLKTYTRKLTNFGHLEDNRFNSEYYPYEVTLTRLYAGLGDFDKDFAHLTVYKDDLFTIPNINFRGDFRGRDEYKYGFNHRESDMYIQVRYRIDVGKPFHFVQGDREGQQGDREGQQGDRDGQQGDREEQQGDGEYNYEAIEENAELLQDEDGIDVATISPPYPLHKCGGISDPYQCEGISSDIDIEMEILTEDCQLAEEKRENEEETLISSVSREENGLGQLEADFHGVKTYIDFTAMYLDTNRDLVARQYFLEKIFLLQNETITENWQFISLDVSWKYLFGSAFLSNNRINSNRTSDRIRCENLGLVLGLQYENKFQEIKISYQRDVGNNEMNWAEGADIVYSEEKTEDNILGLSYNLNHEKFQSELNIILFEDISRINMQQKSVWDFHRNINILTDLNYSDVVRPFLKYRIENHIFREMKGGLRIKYDKEYIFTSNPEKGASFFVNSDRIETTIQADFMLGEKNISQFRSINNPTEEMQWLRIKEDFMTFSSDISASLKIYDFVLFLNNRFEYDNFQEQFYLLPEYSNTLELSLAWYLRHNNQMRIGSRVSFMGDVINDSGVLRQSNPVVDAYFALGITKLFDIKLEINNIYRNMIFGNEILNDYHISSYLVWYFIN